jgi:hypothetical protein
MVTMVTVILPYVNGKSAKLLAYIKKCLVAIKK